MISLKVLEKKKTEKARPNIARKKSQISGLILMMWILRKKFYRVSKQRVDSLKR
jgi:hypothetical protein